MSAKQVALGTFIAFTVGVVCLSVFGHKFLNQIQLCDTTVSYLDLARQAVDARDYKRADEMYKQALIYARQDPTGQAESAMLLGYAKFACEKKKDRQLAVALQARGQDLRNAEAAAKGAGSK